MLDNSYKYISEYVIRIDFPRQKRLRERASMLRHATLPICFFQKIYILHTDCVYVFCMGLRKTHDISLYSIKWPVSVTQSENVYFAVRTKALNIILVNISLQWAKRSAKNSWNSSISQLMTCEAAPVSFCLVRRHTSIQQYMLLRSLSETSVEIAPKLHFPQIHHAATDSRPETFLSFTLHVTWKPFIKWNIVSCLAEKNRQTDIQDVSFANTKLTQATDISENLQYSRVYAQQPILSLL